MTGDKMYLFGGKEPWNPADWTASDDRVRGGNSQSFFYANAYEPNARFHGELDIKTLGGAGFASQRTTGENRTWDLSAFDGVEIDVVGGDDKRYTLNLKDTLLDKDPKTGREQASISYEYDFQVSDAKTQSCGGDSTPIYIPFSDLKATYRGREKEDAAPLDTKSVKRFSLMMRSFFGGQEGAFNLKIRSIKAVKKRKGKDGKGDEEAFLGEKGIGDFVQTRSDEQDSTENAAKKPLPTWGYVVMAGCVAILVFHGVACLRM